jgi:hypothetical protein
MSASANWTPWAVPVLAAIAAAEAGHLRVDVVDQQPPAQGLDPVLLGRAPNSGEQLCRGDG